MRTDALDFELPESLIATKPAEPRDMSRLLVVSRSDPDRLEDRRFVDLPRLLNRDDLLVFNRSSVVPARFLGVTIETGGKVEGLYLHDAEGSDSDRPYWVAYIKAKRPRVGRRVAILNPDQSATGIEVEFIEPYSTEGPGAWVVGVDGAAGKTSAQVLEAVGVTPLPPYIVTQRRAREELIDDTTDRASYQTMYANPDESGSVAAPTAGLHFTPRVMDGLERQGVRSSEVVLHVGAGTFKPIEADDLQNHQMHSEQCSMGDAVELFRHGKPSNGRVIAVGSTSTRTLESYAKVHGTGGSIEEPIYTDIMISPGYEWRWVDGMVTNFHLPRSTLIAMVASMLDPVGESGGMPGIERVQRIYAHAIHNEYRFFSYGDAMLILP